MREELSQRLGLSEARVQVSVGRDGTGTGQFINHSACPWVVVSDVTGLSRARGFICINLRKLLSQSVSLAHVFRLPSGGGIDL